MGAVMLCTVSIIYGLLLAVNRLCLTVFTIVNAQLLEEGKGREKDLTEAVKFYEKAVQAGVRKAQSDVARLNSMLQPLEQEDESKVATGKKIDDMVTNNESTDVATGKEIDDVVANSECTDVATSKEMDDVVTEPVTVSNDAGAVKVMRESITLNYVVPDEDGGEPVKMSMDLDVNVITQQVSENPPDRQEDSEENIAR